jgi:eukaryotic-like serine/threonine-protein kinase
MARLRRRAGASEHCMIEIPGITVTQKLTEGGCAEIFAGVDQSSGKQVAVKVLHPRHLSNKVEYKRLVDEGALTMKLSADDNIVQVIKTGFTSDKLPYIVLEYIKGATLRELIVIKRVFTDLEILNLAKRLSRALRFLHNNGIVHKDVKPDNIMITTDGRVKLLDFGFAENFKGFSLFGKKTLEGSPAYMAPELFATKKATPQSDIFSLGVTLYEAATHILPFSTNASSTAINLQRDVQKSVTSVSTLNANIKIPTERMILTACQKDTAKRFKSVDEILLDLARNPGLRNARDSFRFASVTA